MRTRGWSRVLATLLTVAMIATLLVVPASAAPATGNASQGIYVLDFRTDSVTPGSGKDAVGQAGTANYFGVNAGTVKSAKHPAIGDSSSDDYIAAATSNGNEWSSGGTTNVTGSKPNKYVQRYIKITTENDNAKVKLWWYTSSTSRNVAIYGAFGTDDSGQTLPSALWTSAKGSTVGGYCEETTIATAGTYYIGATASISIVRIEVEDKAVVSENDRTVSFTVPEGITVKNVTVGDAEKTWTATGMTKSIVAAKADAVTFKVDAAEGATISSVKVNGVAIEAAEEVYTIPASENDQTVTFDVTSNFNHAASVSLNETTKTVKDMTAFTLTATVTGEDASKECTDAVTWKSSLPAVATVSDAGVVTPKAIGTTIITAEAGGKSDSCTVSVTGADQNGPTYVFESKNVAEMSSIATNFAYNNYFTVLNGGGFNSSSQNWSDGYSSGVRYNGGSMSTTKQAIKFTTTKGSAEIKVWWRYNKLLQILDAAGNEAYLAPESSSGSCIDTYTAQKAGTWYVGGKSGAAYIYKIEVTEKEAVTDVTLTHGHMDDGGDGSGHTIYVGGTGGQGDKTWVGDTTKLYPSSWKMDVAVAPATADQGVTWSVAEGSEDIITVDQNGVVSPVGTKLGTGVVVVTSKSDPTKLAHCDVTVAPYITGVTIDQTSPTTTMGVADAAKLKLTAALALAGGVTADQLDGGQDDITWSSSDPTVLTVGEHTGVVTPLKAGTATVTATSEKLGPRAEAKTASVTVTVNKGTLNMGVAVDSATQPAAGGTAVVTVTGVRPNGDLQYVTVKAQAAGGSEITATKGTEVNQWEVALPENTGSSPVEYTITASYNGVNWEAADKTATVTVNAAGQKTLTVSLSPSGEAEVVKGSSLTLTASPKLDGAATNEVTYQWAKDGTAIPGETGATLTVTEAGSYTCTVTGIDGKDTAGLTKTSTAVVITEKLPALTGISAALKAPVDGVTYTAGTPNTLVINGKKTVVFDVTMTPEENDEGGTLDTDLQVVDGQRLVNVQYDATAKTLTVTPARASANETVPRKLTLKGTEHPDVTWEVMITVKKLAAPATLTETDVTATAPTSATGKGTITIQNAVVGQVYRYKLDSADTWTDTPAATSTTVTIPVDPGTYQVRQKVDATFQNIPGSLTVVVDQYVAPSHTIAVYGDISDGNVEVDEEAQEGSTVTVVITPDDGYKLAKLWYVKDGDTAENAITTKTAAGYTFTMPETDITIYATFEEGEPAMWDLDFVVTETLAKDATVESVEGIKLTVGSAFNWNAANADGTSTEQTLPAEAGMAGVLKGSNNGPGSATVPSGDKAYLKFDATKDGSLLVAYAVFGSNNKTVYVVDGTGTAVPDAGETNFTGNGYSEFDVEAGGTYYVYAGGANIGFYGFSFTADEGDDPNPPAPETKTVTFAVGDGTQVTQIKVDNEPANLVAGKLTDIAKSAVVTFVAAVTDPAKTLKVTGATFANGVYTVTADTVTLTAVAADEYTITCDTAVNGTVTTDKTVAKAGETVTVTATPATGYELETITVNGEAITGNTFTMPAKDVTVSATFKQAAQPSQTPSQQPSDQPSQQPSDQPSQQPSDQPSQQPSDQPSQQPSDQPSDQPSQQPSEQPSQQPSEQPSAQPSQRPSGGLSPAPASRPAATTPSTSTVNNPAGGKTTVKKDANGNVTITATDDKGEVLAEVKLPATVSAVGYKFVDVPEGHWAEDAINTMAGLQLVKGVNETQHIFDMVSPITRGSVATILSRLANGKADVKDIFSDVAEGQWYAEGVAWAAKAGVVNGFENGTFRPDASITREQLAVMLARYAKLLGLDTSAANNELAIFNDADDIQSWALEGMAWCVKVGIVHGRGDGTVDPSANATRAEATAMLARLVDLLK